ncbi:hypothetical protein BD309DRAFT_871272 [Dichomitus squalens]|uniref:Uncharacterized protein n=1 Tax=Dichomitus squalens (strain LYAD-421) TaxID=732165 RepID=R7T031_DICSQ|nr:uncharacterized protein DICSQDRAFT_155141 [Dichomitus squalens LYAD-421 SS1]EJF61340.1 hypothetical protein DICSQDRAFT_155141 [Dichomitus squalens LYAD-421 SS1]TBU39940.1 hypothetical protein BD309DRAFT_871272 [Dichomitus squalens]
MHPTSCPAFAVPSFCSTVRDSSPPVLGPGKTLAYAPSNQNAWDISTSREGIATAAFAKLPSACYDDNLPRHLYCSL